MMSDLLQGIRYNEFPNVIITTIVETQMMGNVKQGATSYSESGKSNFQVKAQNFLKCTPIKTTNNKIQLFQGHIVKQHSQSLIFTKIIPKQNYNYKVNKFLLAHRIYIPKNYHFCWKQLPFSQISLLISRKMTSYTSNAKTPFSGMTLTQIFQIQPLQSLFIKFWYLGLTSDCIISQEDQNLFKTIKKNITFANCFSFQMPIKTYVAFMERIMVTLERYDTKKTFQVLLAHLKNNKVMSISFQLFGVAFLQLFGRNLEFINTQIMNKILRQIFVNLTLISKTGTAILKPIIKQIAKIDLEAYIPNLSELLEQKNNQKLVQNPQKIQINLNKSVYDTQVPLNTLKGRLQSQRNHNLEMRQTAPDQYPIGQKMRTKQKANLACYMVGGFQIVDYSDSINNLHKKLLTKILLNK